MKLIKSFICLTLACLASGCTELLWKSTPVSETTLTKSIKMQDRVIAAFQYQNLAASVINEGKKTPLPIPTAGIAFLGEKNIYILTVGTNDLLAMDKISAQIPLLVRESYAQYNNDHDYYEYNSNLKIRITPVNKNSPVMQFRHHLDFHVERPSLLTGSQRVLLQQAGITEKTEYRKSFIINGISIPRKNLDYSFNDIKPLDKNHEIDFYTVQSTTNYDPVNIASRVVFTPVTLISDIILYPLWHQR